MKIITYNVNGIRSALEKGFADWLKATAPDVVCLQEIKATAAQIPVALFEEMGYHCFWYPAEKKGYSGVAILSRIRPLHVAYGCGIEAYDKEGRVIRADYENCSVMSVYMPSGSSGEERQDFKFLWLDDFYTYINDLRLQYPNLVISGDYNICHQEIDIHSPVRHQKSSGFLPEERAWLSKFIAIGFVDTFRELVKEPHHYTWWSYRANSRKKNLGWRIDYHLISQSLRPHLKRCNILAQAYHSDHCPVLLELF